jgi:hypothetical protein
VEQPLDEAEGLRPDDADETRHGKIDHEYDVGVQGPTLAPTSTPPPFRPM